MDRSLKKELHVVRIAIPVLMLGLCVPIASAQSLGDAARREKKRRDQNRRSGTAVRVIHEAEIGLGPEVVSRPEPVPDAEGNVATSPTLVMTPGDPAPDFSLPDASGRTYSLSDFRGRPLLLDFWATWCAPCRATMPEVERLHRKFRSDLQVVGINIEGNGVDVEAYLEAGDYSFRVLLDEGNWKAATVASYGITSIPRTFLIDGRGRILYQGHPRGLSEERIVAAIQAR